jgi:hypothetical protein
MSSHCSLQIRFHSSDEQLSVRPRPGSVLLLTSSTSGFITSKSGLTSLYVSILLPTCKRVSDTQTSVRVRSCPQACIITPLVHAPRHAVHQPTRSARPLPRMRVADFSCYGACHMFMGRERDLIVHSVFLTSIWAFGRWWCEFGI